MFKKIEKKILFIPFLPVGWPRNHEYAPSFSPWPNNAPSSLCLVSLTGGPRMSALYSTTLNRTRVGIRRRVYVDHCYDSAPLMPPPIALPPKPPALLNSSRRPSRLSPSCSKSQRRLQLTTAASLEPCMKLTPTLSSPRRCCSYYDVVTTSVISLSSLYWPLPSPTSGRDLSGLRRRESEVAQRCLALCLK